MGQGRFASVFFCQSCYNEDNPSDKQEGYLMHYHLRKAIAADFDSINHLFQEMLQSIYKTESAQGYAPGALDYYFSGGEDWICVAEAKGTVIGFLAIEVHRGDPDYLYYDDCCVSASCRNKGIGSALMDAAEAYGASIGVSSAVLHVEASNKAAQRLYERHGFTILREDGCRLCMHKKFTR